MSISLFSLAFPVLANEFSVSNKTFFSNGKLDRIFFKDNGEFQQQLDQNYSAIHSGQLLIGQWKFNSINSELCMNYTQPKLNMICLNLIKNDNSNEYSVVDKVGKLHLKWNHYREGNWLLKSDKMSFLMEQIKEKNLFKNDYLENVLARYKLTNKIITIGNDLEILTHSTPTPILKNILKKENPNIFVTNGDEFLEKKDIKEYFYILPDLIYTN